MRCDEMKLSKLQDKARRLEKKLKEKDHKVSLCMCVHGLCVHVCVHVYVCIVYMCVHGLCVHMYVCMCVCMCVCVCVCVCVYMCVSWLCVLRFLS